MKEFNPKIIEDKIKVNPFFNSKLNEKEKEIFQILGITPYSHQVLSYRYLVDGKNVILSSPTSSGKTESFLSYIIDLAFKGKNSLIIFPTKALTKDQIRRINSLRIYGVDCAIYDGDTPGYRREKIRKKPPRVLLTNFDMLHYILLNHQKFSKFFSNLNFVVVDEVHVYSGSFGSNIHYIIKRLKRIIRKQFKKDLQFFASSATISNPKQFCELLFGEKFTLVNGIVSKHMVYYLISPEDSYITTSLKIAKKLGKKTIIFANSRNAAERLCIIGKKMGLSIAVYRAGLDKALREKIESEFKKGKIRILASTSALELGVDIGSVDVVILAGFPGTITRFRQRVGRAGRNKKGYGIFVARESPLDQYYYENEVEFVNGKNETVFLNINNDKIRRIHLLAMAKEIVLEKNEIGDSDLEWALNNKYLSKIGNFFIPTIKALKIINSLNIRSYGRRILIYHNSKIIGEREESIAVSELYPGAIYLHNGEVFVSEELNLSKGYAQVKKCGLTDIYTTPLISKDIEILEEFDKKEYSRFNVYHGKIFLSNEIYGYVVKDVYSSQTLSKYSFEEPYNYSYETNAIWFEIDKNWTHEGLHALEHVFISMSHSITGSDPKEVGGMSYADGTIFVYDAFPGGIGISKVLFDNFLEILRRASKRITNCNCRQGCPKCILDPMCGNDNKYLDKENAKLVLDYMLEEVF